MLLNLFKKTQSEGFTEIYKQYATSIEDRYYEIYEEEKNWIKDYLISNDVTTIEILKVLDSLLTQNIDINKPKIDNSISAINNE